MRGGYYRPLYYHTLAPAWTRSGNLVAWQHRIVGQSIIDRHAVRAVMVKDGIDDTSVEGAANLPYAIPNLAVELHTTEVGVPVLWWRSVGSTHTAYSTEVFIDELAHAAGKDPVAFRRALLKHIRATRRCWTRRGEGRLGQPAAGGPGARHRRARVVRHLRRAGRRGHGASERRSRWTASSARSTAASPVNPDVIRAQMEGGIGFGLGAALYGEITLEGGRVRADRTSTTTACCASTRCRRSRCTSCRRPKRPTGVGEPGVPPIAPAVANAVFAATGRRVRNLPFTRDQSV